MNLKITYAITAIAVSTLFFACEKEEPLTEECGAMTTGEKQNGTEQEYQTKQISRSNPNLENEHIITEEEAAEYISRFKATYPNMNTESYWTKRALHELLAQPNTTGTRYYFGQDETGDQEVIFVSVDAEENDVVAPGKVIKANRLAALLADKIQAWQDKQLIALEKAAAATARHRNNQPENTIAGTFNKEAMQLLLTHGAVFGVHSEYGLNEHNRWVIILRPLDRDGRIIPGLIIERSKPCPPSCGKPNILNS